MSKKNFTRIDFVDKGWGVMLKRMIAADPQVIVGVMEGLAEQPHDDDSDTTIGEVAMFNEFGTKFADARPFLRTAVVWNSEAAVKKIMAKVARNVVLGTPKHIAIREAGRWAVRRVVDTIKSRVFVPNRPSTIDKKGHDYTLRDSYTLVKSIGFKVATGMKNVVFGGDE